MENNNTNNDAENPIMKLFELEYKEVRDHLRHFSNVRSALTTFLMTVELAAFAAYSTAKCEGKSLNYLIVAGSTTLLMSVMVCIIFSYRTEYWNEYSKKLWECIRGDKSKRIELDCSKLEGVMSKNAVCKCAVIKKMFIGPMNWVLLITVSFIFVGFFILNFKITILLV